MRWTCYTIKVRLCYDAGREVGSTSLDAAALANNLPLKRGRGFKIGRVFDLEGGENIEKDCRDFVGV